MADLYKQLEEYGDSDYYPFHMPGHKRNREALHGALEEICGLDITEIDGFDNLHQAQGILRDIQMRAAEIYGSEKTYFLVNGSTCGILSAIAAAAEKGDRLLMARNCHKSVYHAVFLQELEVSYLYPDIVKEYGIADAVAPESVEDALKEQPDVAAVIITSPTYEGAVSDIKEIADITHRYGKPLIVDEAHGAHFGFHEDYPESSVRLGADIVIHSVHKTLPAMTQTALLHVNGNQIDRNRLERYLRIFQTSSPSYVLMASIDNCMDIVVKEGRQRLGRLQDYRCRLVYRMGYCKYLRVAERPAGNVCRMTEMDPCKLLIYAEDGILTGQQLYDVLKKKFHLQMEMAADNYVLAILTMMDTEEGMDRLADALLTIDKDIAEGVKTGKEPKKASDGKAYVKPKQGMTIVQAYNKETEWIRLESSVGRIAAEFINLYPPGIPLIVPGEIMNEDMVELIRSYQTGQLNVQGVTDGCVKVIRSCRSLV